MEDLKGLRIEIPPGHGKNVRVMAGGEDISHNFNKIEIVATVDDVVRVTLYGIHHFNAEPIVIKGCLVADEPETAEGGITGE